MSPKQKNLIAALAVEKDLSTLRPEQRDYLARIADGSATPDFAGTRRIIDALLALPRIGGTVAAPVAAPTVEVEAGRYAIVDEADGRIRFFVVDRPTEGRWIGRTFVSEQASDEKYPVRGPRRNEILAAIAVDAEGALRRYGVELGRCGVCGRTLTDETSRAAGIGPDCAARLGIDRTPARAALSPDRTPTSTTSAPAGVDGSLDMRDDEDYAFGGGHRADVAAEEAAERAAEAREGSDTSPAPATQESGSYSGLRAAAGRVDPNARLGWRERKAAVAEQQGRGDVGRDYVNGNGRSQLQTLPGTTFEDIFRSGS